VLVQFFLWLCFFFSVRFILLDSVLLVGIFGLIFSLIICYLVRFFFRSWFRAIVVIVYVGGLLVIFSYFLAVCPNEVIRGKWGAFLISVGGAFIIMILGNNIYSSPLSLSRLTEVDMIYRSFNFPILIFLVLVLLIRLFTVVSIVGIREGPLRPFSN
jgi:hypothetical protein